MRFFYVLEHGKAQPSRLQHPSDYVRAFVSKFWGRDAPLPSSSIPLFDGFVEWAAGQEGTVHVDSVVTMGPHGADSIYHVTVNRGGRAERNVVVCANGEELAPVC